MSAVEVFRFEASTELRVVQINGEPWFVLADLCRALDLSNPAMVAGRVRLALGDDALSLAEVTDSIGRAQSVTIVSEAGLYEVTFRSDKPGALAFRRWVSAEVLPQIRRTGSYGAPAALDPTTPEGMRLVLQAATAALAELEVVKPKAAAWDELAAADGDYSVNDAAKLLARAGIEIGSTRLFRTLAELGWTYRRGGRPQARQRLVDRGFLRHRAQSYRHPETDELVVADPQVRITPEGVRALRDRLRASEPLPELTG